VKRDYPEVTVIPNDTNLGFATANNVAIRATQSTYVATLNNDTRVEPTWLAELVSAMESDPSVGMCASKQLLAATPRVIDSAGISVDRVGIAWDRLGGEADSVHPESRLPVFGPCAAAALYRREMLDQIGGFDEDFFAYMEDVDLAWRAQLVGWQCLYVPTARVYHAHSGTGKEGSPRKRYLLGRNTVWTIAKNYPWPHILTYSPAIVAYQLLALVYGLFTGREISPLRGRLAALRAMPSVMRKRRAVQALRTVSSAEMLSRLNPIENPLRVARRYRHLQRPPTGES
jgi:GT2 family glycosyltransferase